MGIYHPTGSAPGKVRIELGKDGREFVNLCNLDAGIRQTRGWLASNRAIANNFLLISAKDQLADVEARRQKIAEALNDGRRKAIEAPGKKSATKYHSCEEAGVT